MSSEHPLVYLAAFFVVASSGFEALAWDTIMELTGCYFTGAGEHKTQ